MALADLHQPSVDAKRQGCGLRRIRERLDDDDRAWLARVLAADSGETNRAIADTLTRAGYTIGHQVIQRHRSGVCSCKHLED
ncbi:hypothetical protein DNL40_02425 [Xylanimonas oleitrophica]|uniref:Uncharacterized protein n=1 Tax=Xylanimonas oleitrophica TaxID=2607479 RepID=A0A2W5X2U7_9MICO|nr:hypothetical protein [Xylanimonas oleitrophica]PZR55246.1 hypothetical protein DNL40_02425 [Xylanimonas oleitrophica]